MTAGSRLRRGLVRSRRPAVIAVELGVIMLFLVIAAAVWILIHALDATGRLADARNDISNVRTDLINGRPAMADLHAAERDTAAAQHDTHDVVWGLASWLSPVHTVRGITTSLNTLTHDALPPLVKVGPTLQPARLRVAANTIALHPLVAAAPTLRQAATAMQTARQQVSDLPGGWIGLISTARDKVLAQLTSLAGSVDDASRFATVGPAMLGEHGLRRYFVGVENNAESRSTGGLVAAYAIVTADHGKIRVTQHGNDSAIEPYISPRPVASLGADYDRLYGNYQPTQRWITSNLSPNFPDAADIWAHLWQVQFGQHIDGVFGVDPFALQAMLGAVGPVQVAGYPGSYDGSNLASFIEQGEYAAFPGLNNPLRKEFMAEVATAVLNKVLSGSGDPQAIATALGRSAGQGHLTLWSGRPAEEAVLAPTPLAGILPETTAPFASLSVDNASGSKLDYYLDRSLTYTAGSCSSDRRDSTITVRLLNAAPRQGLPEYVRLRTETNINNVEAVPRSHLFVFVHATDGAALSGATLDGRPVQVGEGVERGHPVFFVDLILDPGVPRVINLRLSEPTTSGRAQTKIQPLARVQHTRFDVPTCT